MPIVNGLFQTAVEGLRYEAEGWTRTVIGTAAPFAPFHDGVTEAVNGKEDFEAGWGPFTAYFRGFFRDIEQAYFDFSVNNPKVAEDFEDLWGATPARVSTGSLGETPTSEPTALAPFALKHGQTLVLRVGSGAAQTLVFREYDFTNLGAARAGELAENINLQLKDAVAFVDARARRVRIDTIRTGVSVRLQVLGGSANDVLKFDTAEMVGGQEAGAFFRAVEFGFADWDGADASMFGDAPLVRLLDPACEAPDEFSWAPVKQTITLVTMLTPESFSGWPSNELMTSVF